MKLDDLGLLLMRNEGAGGIPRLRRAFGGGILVHGIAPLHHLSVRLAAGSGLVAGLGPTLVSALVGIVAGGLAVAALTTWTRVRWKKA